MNSTGSVSVINIKSIIWDLLSQWKAILISAILVALLVPGMKFAKDSKAYEAALENQAQAEAAETEKLSTDEKIEAVLEPLSASDRSDVEFVMKEKEWIRAEREYLNKSLYLNNNPTNQRTLMIDYRLLSNDPGNMTALIYGYANQIYEEPLLKKLGKAIDPELESKYISELIWCDTSRVNNVELDTTNMVIEFRVVVPEKTNAEQIEQILTEWIKGRSAELARSIGGNSVSLLSLIDTRKYNGDAVNNRTNITYAIYNVQNNIKNSSGLLSDAAKAAIAAVDAIYEAEAKENDEVNSDTTPAPEPPHFRKKYAALGFILGAMMYTFIYILLIMLNGNMTSAADMGYYTGSRLIGEIYSKSEHDGIKKLLYSGVVDRFRYRGKLEEAKQVEKAVSSIEAVSKHAETDKISMLCMPGISESLQNVMKSIVEGTRDKGVTVETINIDEDIDENQLNTIENGIIVASNFSKAGSVAKLNGLCREFGVKQLGDIYVRQI